MKWQCDECGLQYNCICTIKYTQGCSCECDCQPAVEVAEEVPMQEVVVEDMVVKPAEKPEEEDDDEFPAMKVAGTGGGFIAGCGCGCLTAYLTFALLVVYPVFIFLSMLAGHHA